MKRLLTIFSGLILVTVMSGAASAQRGHGHGRPATTGIEHAETRGNVHGQRGIENAEAKQAEHKKTNPKHRKHHKSHRDDR